MSFSETEPQYCDGSKTNTRRMGWLDLKAGDRVIAIRKGMGLKKGERQVVLGEIDILDVRRERLDAITQEDVIAEGFPDWTPAQFVEFFCQVNRGCKPETVITRIEFRHVLQVGDRVLHRAEDGTETLWRLIGITREGSVQLSGPLPARGVAYCDPGDVVLVKRRIAA